MNIHKEIQRARAREGTQGVYTLFSTLSCHLNFLQLVNSLNSTPLGFYGGFIIKA